SKRAHILLMLIDPDADRPPAAAVLRQLWGLTPSEARLAVAMSGGRDLQVIADELGIAIGTARIQLKGVFAKTETNRQAQLCALLERISIVPARKAGDK